MIEYFRFSMPGFFALALGACTVTPISFFVLQATANLSLAVRGAVVWPICLFSPYVAIILWIAIIVMTVRVHRWLGLWLLTTAIIILPLTVLHYRLVLGCALNPGSCL